MARLIGVEIPDAKRVEIALTYVKGIGLTTSKKILNKVGIDLNTRVKDLSEDELGKISSEVANLDTPTEGELRRRVTQNIRRLQEINSYRGLRHSNGLPARGQRTSHNARTRKGKKKTVGGIKKKLEKK